MNRPPLNALHVFCVVVRSGGFRQAAAALHVTPGAISRQVRMLEEHLHTELFERTAGGLAIPTPAGARLHARVASEMDVITEAISPGGRSSRRSTLTIDTSVTFAMYWLMPCLKRFSERHPNIQVQVRTTDGPIPPASPADVFIRRDPAELRGLPSTVFMAEQSVLVASPAFQAKLSTRHKSGMKRLATVPRVATRSRPDLWQRWSGAHGLDRSMPPAFEYDNTVLAIQAALQGMGVLVVPELFVSEMIATGALVLLSRERVRTGDYSFSIGRKKESARTIAFTQWLMSFGTAGDTRGHCY